jgi:molybdopterin-synthase adenylyltransferase
MGECMIMSYQEFTSRNSGYIPSDIQEKIGKIRVLIAGCGIGRALARLGVQKFSLIDGDTVSLSNLNRQFFDQNDIGQFKAKALADKILLINPACKVDIHNIFLAPNNVDSIFAEPFDLVIDSIDFVDVLAIHTLHVHALARGIPVLSMLSIGFGSGALLFSPQKDMTFLGLLKIKADEELTNQKYITAYASLVDRLEDFLGVQVMTAVREAFKKMVEGTPCPVSQIVSGAYACGTLASHLLIEFLSGRHIPTAPEFMYLDLKKGLLTKDIS